ncbi:MAG: hypothetical protein KKF65_05635 [Nanoarchaeota archaeon]|nr:hypothetical protein [Nanoarchaeota archaeon]
MRITVRFNEAEKLQLEQLKQYLHEEDMSKVVKFALDTSLHHINFVTGMAVSQNWNVIFTRKRKCQGTSRRVY